jgi:phosphoribosylformylglycinamidine synthase
VDAVQLIKVYTVEGLADSELEQVLERRLLHDPVLHQASFEPLAKDLDWIIEVAYRPGVTDNEGRVAGQTLRAGLAPEDEVQVYTATEYLLHGELTRGDAERVAREFLCNELIEQFRIKARSEWEAEPGFSAFAPRVTGEALDRVEVVPISEMDEEGLTRLSEEGTLALSPVELETIRAYYAREDVRENRKAACLDPEPTDAELEVLAQTWSEHCKHKIFNASIRYTDRTKGRTQEIESLFKTYIVKSTEILRRQMGEADYCLSVFGDNAGVIRFDEAHNVCVKVETHNSPSALDPYGGALTGIVGVNRDPMGTGLGANLLCNTDVFCFASPFFDQPLPPRLLHPQRVFEGVRKGVEDGGNQSGIPTVNGGLVFDERYLGKPLVFCGTVGLMPATIQGRPSQEKLARPGDRIVMVGGRVGKDGIHGATFSSEALHSGSPATAVQIGDPITQRKMYDFLMRARDRGLYNSITDNGAGGLSSSVGEMAEESDGCEMDLARVPLKYDGLLPWEILLSEAQERMTVAVPPEHLETFLELAREMDVEATDLGQFTDSGLFRVTYGDKPVARLDMDFMHNGLPRMELEADWDPPKGQKLEIPRDRDPGQRLRRMLGELNICSREYVIRQYDHEVQGGSAIKPLMGESGNAPSDAAVLRPVLDSERGLVVSNGICPRYSDLDTYWMMAWAVDEAIRNAVAVGADPDAMAGVDNFCWCDPVKSERTPDGEYKLAQLVRANQALSHFCLGFRVPCISGKDSMKNDYYMEGYKISIPPTVLFSLVSVVPDVSACISSDFKRPGDAIYLLGLTRDELGGSELAAQLGRSGAGKVPQVDLLSARARYRTLYRAVRRGLVSACHDLSDGGLGPALAEMAIGGELGAAIDLDLVPARPRGLSPEEKLYSESPSRLLVCVPQDRRQAFEELFGGQSLACLGGVAEDQVLSLTSGGAPFIRESVADLLSAWQATMDW